MRRANSGYYAQLMEAYKRAQNVETCTVREFLTWAQQNGHLQMSPHDLVDFHAPFAARELRHAMTDDAEMECRRYHSVRVVKTNPETGREEVLDLWGDLHDDPKAAFLLSSIGQRLQQVRDDFKAIARDVEGIAKRPRYRKLGATLKQMLLDFNPRDEANGEGAA